MKRENYRQLIYFIAATIAATIALQVYWNIKNYQANKQRLINEVQISLDNGIESYFADLAKTEVFAFVQGHADSLYSGNTRISMSSSSHLDSMFLEVEADTVNWVNSIHGFAHLIDSSEKHTRIRAIRNGSFSTISEKNKMDSLTRLQGLANRIIVSITNDSLDFRRLDTLLGQELNRKNIAISYRIKHSRNDSVLGGFGGSNRPGLVLSTLSKSTYLPEDEKLELIFSNPSLTILKRSTTGILLSFVLSMSIIACLLYLLRIVNKQKQLAEIKNDLISNITHEFKTPITTVATALEGLKNFNEVNSKEKTLKYLDISQNQLQKLHLMVEKLLETATLDNDKILLHKEKTDLVILLKMLVEKFQMISDKSISYKNNTGALIKEVDPFHFENALANLLDNAVKYGGQQIEVHLNSLLNGIEITVADNGKGIDKTHREKIFEKFYRIPTGNIHDVKGFGIGLFYAKTIIEKHGGTLSLVSDSKNSIFRITI